MWDSIASKVYADTKYTDIILKSNPEHRMVYIFSAGVELDVPEIEERISSDDLPPWKRADG